MEVKCPRCGKPALFAPENPNRPFCSERCQLIDLGAWAEEKYAIPVGSHVDQEDEEGAEPMPDSESPPTPTDDEGDDQLIH